jgi:hypothetical protein
MNLKEYLFYSNITTKELAQALGFHHTHVRNVLCGVNKVSKKLSIAVEAYTNGVVKQDNVLGPFTHPRIKDLK